MPLNVCFVDLPKAYDSVDHELLWKVLARAGIPAEIIAAIHQFHDGMQAPVRMDDGELSYWFLVTQGLRQGCVAVATDVQHILHRGARGHRQAVQRGRSYHGELGDTEGGVVNGWAGDGCGERCGRWCMPMTPVSCRGQSKD